MDYKELFLTPEFNAYQDMLADAIAGYLHQVIMKGNDPNSTIKDAVGLAHVILTLPKQLVKDDDFGKRLDERIQERYRSIPKRMLLKEMYG